MKGRISLSFHFIVAVLCIFRLFSPVAADAQSLFETGGHYGAGLKPRSIAVGHLDGDSAPDLAVANFNGDNVSVLLGRGDGSFRAAVHFGAGDAPSSVAIDDLNRDGRADLAVTNQFGDNVSILLNRGGGSFDSAVNYGTGQRPRSVAVGDLNHDGYPDLAVANVQSDFVTVLLGNGDGTFQNALSYWADDYAVSIVMAHLNGDGHPDLAVGNSWYENKVTVLLGNGDGTFQAAQGFSTGPRPASVAAGDLNEDGFRDLAAACYQNEAVILLGDGDGDFTRSGNFGIGRDPRSIAVGDLDGDGHLDLAAANFMDNNVSVLLGYGNGAFRRAVNFSAGSGPESVAVRDLDGDSDLDLAVANSGSNNITIFINTTVTHVSRVVAGPGPAYQNPAHVRIFPPLQDADHTAEFSAYGPQHNGVNVTCGDVDGDGLDEILTGPGPGAVFGPHVRGFEVFGIPIQGLSFIAYGTRKWGVNVAAGDIDGDNTDEIITGAGPGAVFGPHVRAFRYDGGMHWVVPVWTVNFMAYSSRHWGVNVAAGDIDGDGYDEILTGPGPGVIFGPHVRGWNVDGGDVYAMSAVNYFAYDLRGYGVVVSGGDADGDGFDEIVTAPGPGADFFAHIIGWNFDNAFISPLPGCSFTAWPPSEARYGARVFAGADLDDDTRCELVIGAGRDPAVGPLVKAYHYDGASASLWFSLGNSPTAWTQGANVAAGRF
jgi:hypothetical protein